jgi:hypothetical protein
MRRSGRDSRTLAVHEGMFDEHIVDSVLRSFNVQHILRLIFSCRICCKTANQVRFWQRSLIVNGPGYHRYVNTLGWTSDRICAVCLLVYTSESTCPHYDRNSRPHVNRENDTKYSTWINVFPLWMVLSQALRLFTSVNRSALLAAGPDFHFHSLV